LADSATASVTYNTGEEGIDGVWFEFGADLAGRDWDLESTYGDPDIGFFDECGGDEIEFHTNAGGEEGTIPADATCALGTEFATEEGSTLTFTIR
jgi:hypothetical protein